MMVMVTSSLRAAYCNHGGAPLIIDDEPIYDADLC